MLQRAARAVDQLLARFPQGPRGPQEADSGCFYNHLCRLEATLVGMSHPR